MVMRGEPAKPGWVVPSITIASLIAGSGDSGETVCGPAPIENVIVSNPASAFDSSIAARNVHTPQPTSHTPSPGFVSEASPVEFTASTACGVSTTLGLLSPIAKTDNAGPSSATSAAISALKSMPSGPWALSPQSGYSRLLWMILNVDRIGPGRCGGGVYRFMVGLNTKKKLA
jgi:hypothetical protein